MQLRWLIILPAVFAAIVSRVECKTPNSIVDFNDQRWQRALQAINDAERLRQEDKAQPSPGPERRQQRPNDRRMKWRTNSKQLRQHPGIDFEGRSGTYISSTMTANRNPSYLDVADYAPTEAPWWFN